LNDFSQSTSAPISSAGVRGRALVLAFLAVLVDGFDTATLSFAIPALAHEWNTSPAAFTVAMALTNIGTVIGYLTAGMLSARFGRRNILLIGVAWCGLGTLLTAGVLPLHSMTALGAVRLMVGLGLGAVLPVAVSFTADHFVPEQRERVTVAVTLGLATGATLGGFFGGRLLATLEPAGVFWFAGALTLVVLTAMACLLPAEAAVAQAVEVRKSASVSRLFDAGVRLNTGLLWAYAFLIFAASYTLISWSPTLLTSYGFSRTEAPLGLAYVSLGGIIGGLVLIPVAARIGIMRALILMPGLGVVFMVIAATAPLGWALLPVLGIAGIGIIAGHIGQTALAVALYGVGTRTTGVGWAAAMGRLGSVVGPAGAGLLLALALSAGEVILVATIPVGAAMVCAFALWRRHQRPHGSVALGAAASGRGEMQSN
jgi:AAHS family 4-hydroxybenzoate transporter-like MFS transporter